MAYALRLSTLCTGPYKPIYQLPLILTAFLHADLINVGYITACVFIRS